VSPESNFFKYFSIQNLILSVPNFGFGFFQFKFLLSFLSITVLRRERKKKKLKLFFFPKEFLYEILNLFFIQRGIKLIFAFLSKHRKKIFLKKKNLLIKNKVRYFYKKINLCFLFNLNYTEEKKIYFSILKAFEKDRRKKISKIFKFPKIIIVSPLIRKGIGVEYLKDWFYLKKFVDLFLFSFKFNLRKRKKKFLNIKFFENFLNFNYFLPFCFFPNTLKKRFFLNFSTNSKKYKIFRGKKNLLNLIILEKSKNQTTQNRLLDILLKFLILKNFNFCKLFFGFKKNNLNLLKFRRKLLSCKVKINKKNEKRKIKKIFNLFSFLRPTSKKI
jgi:hypothetical protein